jgi:hypothetical protein
MLHHETASNLLYTVGESSPTWQIHLSTSPPFPTLNSGALWLQEEF